MALLQDHHEQCDRCSGYIMASGVYRYAMRNSPHLCRCEELEQAIAEAKPVRRKLSISTKARAA